MGRGITPVSEEMRKKVEAKLGRLVGCDEGQREGIMGKLAAMPSRYRRGYLKAVMGKSRAYGVKANCLECAGWKKRYVAECESRACALWPYRPYQKKVEAKRGTLNAGC